MTKKAEAVIPPDFVFNAGVSIFELFYLIFISISLVIGIVFRFVKEKFSLLKYKGYLLIILFFAIVLISYSFSVLYGKHLQKNIYEEWLLNEKDIIESDNVVESSFITVAELQRILDEKPFILDVREDLENNAGRIKGSVHTRLIDVLNGDLEGLPKDRMIYTYCWAGARGERAAEFLNKNNFQAKYLRGGASFWSHIGGEWVGEKEEIVYLSNFYKTGANKKLLTREELNEKGNEDVLIVDTRSKDDFEYYHILESINMTIINTPSCKVADVLLQIPDKSNIVLICDNLENCFDATIIMLELEKKGCTFNGVYLEPFDN